MSPGTILGAIGSRHGDWREVEDLPARGLASGSEVATLRRGGLARYSVLGERPAELYAASVEESLAQADVDAGSVDAVIFFSSTFAAYDDHDVLIRLCDRVGLARALPIGLFEGQCTNFTYALTVARSLQREGTGTVLLLGADVLDESRGSRVLPGAASVFSDSVVSAVVSPHLDRGFRLDHVGHVVEPALALLDPDRDVLRFIDTFAARLRQVCDEAYAATGLDPKDIDHLVLANLAVPVLRNYAAVARVAFDRVPTGNLERLGHCFAHDQLITMDTLVHTGAAASGDRLLVLGVGANHLFSASVMRLL